MLTFEEVDFSAFNIKKYNRKENNKINIDINIDVNIGVNMDKDMDKDIDQDVDKNIGQNIDQDIDLDIYEYLNDNFEDILKENPQMKKAFNPAENSVMRKFVMQGYTEREASILSFCGFIFLLKSIYDYSDV